MTTIFIPEDNGPGISVDLREPYVAGLLAWLWPGAGHLYQRRYAKAMIFMICVLGMFFTGLGLGRGRCVYASWKENDKRWQYVLQVGTGLPALPAVFQGFRGEEGEKPFFPLAERYPAAVTVPSELWFQQIDPAENIEFEGPPIYDGFMAPPAGSIDVNNMDVLGAWHQEMGFRFEIGTLFTVVAGVLNLLVIYDAFAGPAIMRNERASKAEGKAEAGKSKTETPRASQKKKTAESGGESTEGKSTEGKSK